MQGSEATIGMNVRFLVWAPEPRMYLWTFGQIRSVGITGAIVKTDASGSNETMYVDFSQLQENIPPVPEAPQSGIPETINRAKTRQEFLLWFPELSSKLFMNMDVEQIEIVVRGKEPPNAKTTFIYNKLDAGE